MTTMTRMQHATISDSSGEMVVGGLEPASICDGARNMAMRIAADRREIMYLDDDDGEWLVSPDGSVEAA